MEDPSRSTVSLFNLFCDEAGTSHSGEEQDPSFISLIASCNCLSASEADYVQLLLEKEKINISVTLNQPSSVIQIPRSNAIIYILKTRELLGFQFQTAYMSITYLDRFLSLRTLDAEKPWAMQLLCVGCLTLAAKLQEDEVWSLSSFQVAEFMFDVKSIQRMELLILTTLEWRMSCITAFDFLPYLISVLFTKPPPRGTLRMTVELIIAIMKDVSLMDHYPSSIALAAILMSLDRRLIRNTLEMKINAIPFSRSLDLEDVSICYHMMQQSERDQSNTAKLLASPGLSPVNVRRMVSFRNSPSASLISSKRKRLAFDNTDDHNQGLPDKQHHENDIISK